MHSSLAPHLHTEECNKIIAALLQCHAEKSMFQQWLGACNDLDMQMRKCTKNERLGRIDENRQSAKEAQERTKEKLRRYQNEGKSWRDIINEKAKNN